MARKLLNKDSMVEWLSHNRDNIDITGNYMGSSIPTEFRCAEGHTWVTTPNSIKNGTGCPHCSLNARCTVEKFNEYLMINQRPVLMVGEYVNNRTKTKFDDATFLIESMNNFVLICNFFFKLEILCDDH